VAGKYGYKQLKNYDISNEVMVEKIIILTTTKLVSYVTEMTTIRM
jgi:hypothetical protein